MLRRCPLDGMPRLGRPRGFDKLVVDAGLSMMGISLAAVSRRIVADSTEVVPPESLDRDAVAALSPDRFGVRG